MSHIYLTFVQQPQILYSKMQMLVYRLIYSGLILSIIWITLVTNLQRKFWANNCRKSTKIPVSYSRRFTRDEWIIWFYFTPLSPSSHVCTEYKRGSFRKGRITKTYLYSCKIILIIKCIAVWIKIAKKQRCIIFRLYETDSLGRGDRKSVV